MKSEIFPIIISTCEALNNAMDEEWSVIYIGERLYLKSSKQLEGLLEAYGYEIAEKRGKHGVFFIKGRGNHAFDPKSHEIYDPMEIL